LFTFDKNFNAMLLEQQAVETLSDYEIERGKPMPNIVHSLIQRRLTVYLDQHYGERYNVFPELTFAIPGEKDATPDISLCEKKPVDLFYAEPKETEPPLMTVEILSPSQSTYDLIKKTEKYFAFGAKSCWIVVPALRTVYVFSAPQEYRTFVNNDVLKDEKMEIEVPLGEIFN